MEKKTIQLTETELKGIIKEAFDAVLDTNTDNTLGGNPKMDKVIDVLEGWDWAVDQVDDNLIYAHLESDENLQVAVSVDNIGAKLKEVHYTGGDFDSSYGIDLQYLADKLAEVDFFDYD